MCRFNRCDRTATNRRRRRRRVISTQILNASKPYLAKFPSRFATYLETTVRKKTKDMASRKMTTIDFGHANQSSSSDRRINEIACPSTKPHVSVKKLIYRLLLSRILNGWIRLWTEDVPSLSFFSSLSPLSSLSRTFSIIIIIVVDIDITEKIVADNWQCRIF